MADDLLSKAWGVLKDLRTDSDFAVSAWMVSGGVSYLAWEGLISQPYSTWAYLAFWSSTALVGAYAVARARSVLSDLILWAAARTRRIVDHSRRSRLLNQMMEDESDNLEVLMDWFVESGHARTVRGNATPKFSMYLAKLEQTGLLARSRSNNPRALSTGKDVLILTPELFERLSGLARAEIDHQTTLELNFDKSASKQLHLLESEFKDDIWLVKSVISKGAGQREFRLTASEVDRPSHWMINKLKEAGLLDVTMPECLNPHERVYFVRVPEPVYNRLIKLEGFS